MLGDRILLGVFALSFLFLPMPTLSVQLDPIPEPLGPVVSGMASVLDEKVGPLVVNRALAVVLGKAIFWDMQFGTGGVACATCHHHAGTDSRLNGQLAWTRVVPAHDPMRRTKHITSDLFPFVRERAKKQQAQTSTFMVMGSAGIIRSSCSTQANVPVHASGHRVVTSRNALSVINSRFYQRLFWDGRANSMFNGLNSWGYRGASDSGFHQPFSIKKKVGGIANASLASQALSPLMTPGEMICEGESLAIIATRTLPLRVLSLQKVHGQDSVLGPYRASSGYGLTMTYEMLFKKVFSKRLWQASTSHHRRTLTRGSSKSGLESNFGLMLGLALMAYEETLVSDHSPFDYPRGKDGYPLGFTQEQRHGLDLFNRLECDFCHSGPALTSAANFGADRRNKWVDRRIIAPDLVHHSAQVAFLDVGFANIGVTPSEEDAGVGGGDLFGRPLSYAEQYLQTLRNPVDEMVDRIQVDPNDFSIGFNVDFKPTELRLASSCSRLDRKRSLPLPSLVLNEGELLPPNRLGTAVYGAFKIPSLRNVELTGPYMHNGSMKSLEEVIDFYDRGGNFPNPEKIQTFVHPQHLSAEDKRDIKAFLMTLTDERVRWERAPFDHPAIRIPIPKLKTADPQEDEEWVEIPPIGRSGRSITQGPLRSFEDRLRSDSLALHVDIYDH